MINEAKRRFPHLPPNIELQSGPLSPTLDIGNNKEVKSYREYRMKTEKTEESKERRHQKKLTLQDQKVNSPKQ